MSGFRTLASRSGAGDVTVFFTAAEVARLRELMPGAAGTERHPSLTAQSLIEWLEAHHQEAGEPVCEFRYLAVSLASLHRLEEMGLVYDAIAPRLRDGEKILQALAKRRAGR